MKFRTLKVIIFFNIYWRNNTFSYTYFTGELIEKLNNLTTRVQIKESNQTLNRTGKLFSVFIYNEDISAIKRHNNDKSKYYLSSEINAYL